MVLVECMLVVKVSDELDYSLYHCSDKGMEDRKSSSRWDTPSPSAETRWLPPELPPQQSPVGRGGDGGMEGGRGKRKRKRKRGKNRSECCL